MPLTLHHHFPQAYKWGHCETAKSIPINTGETDPDINIAPINIHPDFAYYHHRNHILASIFLKLYVKIDKIGLEIVNLLIGYYLPICYQHT